MVHGVVGLKNGELVMGGILEGDCKDMMDVIQRCSLTNCYELMDGN